MTKHVACRRSCPETVKNRIQQALQATLYILHQTGPTGFLLKEEGTSKKLKVCLGDTHQCSCTTFTREKELCVHILWLLLKKFRVSKDHEVAFQLGLVERDIDKVIHGHLMTQGSKPEDSGETVAQALRREVSEGDVCPICQEELLGTRPSPLAFCKFGCGKSIHLRCVRVWANHLNSTGDDAIPCPLCRNNFGCLKELCSLTHSTNKVGVVRDKLRSLHLGVACSSCGVCPIAGRCYRCATCDGCYLCKSCREDRSHGGHTLEFRQHPNQPWRSARQTQPQSPTSFPPQAPTSFPPDLISSLHDRSLTEEDYDLLLQLDRPPGNTQRVSESDLCSLPVRPLDSDSVLILNGAQCTICNNLYVRGEWTKMLSCKHEFHRDCIDEWIRSGHSVCPIDGKPAITKKKKKKKTEALRGATVRVPMPRDDEVRFSISGQGLGASLPPERTDIRLAPSLPSGGPVHSGIRLAPGHPPAMTSFCRASSGPEENRTRGCGQVGTLPRLDVAGRMLTSGPSPFVAIPNHKVCSRRQLVESSRRMMQQRHEYRHPEEAMGVFQVERAELPKCCGHSICKNPTPSPPPPPPPHALQQSLRLGNTMKARSGLYRTERPKLDTSLHVISYRTQTSPAITLTSSQP